LSHLVVADQADPGAWAARAPDGSASAAIAVAPGPVTPAGFPSTTIDAGPGAVGHAVERELGPVDLSAYDDLELWVRSDLAADGSDARPFFLEVRLGAAANAWQRFVPIGAAGAWQTVPLALDDLDPAVRGGVTQIGLTCVGAPFALDLGPITALRPELLADVDAALVARLGAAAPAVVLPAETEPAQPFFRITSYGARPAPERSPASGFRSDFTGQGFSIRPPSTPFDLFYAVDAVTADRADAARLLEHVYAELTPVAVLEAAGRPLTIESVDGPQLARTEIPGQPTVYLKVSTAQRATGAREPAVPPFNSIDVEADTRAVA
jgi:hypothetical protein